MQRTYTLQLLLGASLKAKHLCITVSVGGPQQPLKCVSTSFQSRVLTYVLLCSTLYERIISFSQKITKLSARNTSRGPQEGGPEASASLASLSTHHWAEQWNSAANAEGSPFVITSDVVETVTFETETWLNFQNETETSSKTPRPRLETSKFVHFAEKKKYIYISSLHLTWNFFQFLAFFQRVLFVSYLQIQQKICELQKF